jgi:hypothetical protein
MGIIRQYLKQKVARTFNGRKVDLDVVKKEVKDELTHVLYDQTRRTPIVIPVINEIGGGGGNRQNNGDRQQNRGQNEHNQNGPARGGEGGNTPSAQQPRDNRDNNGQGNANNGGNRPFKRPAPKNFPAPVVPDTEVVEPRTRPETRGY